MQKITLITTLSVLALAACSPQAPEPAVSAPVAETPAAPAMADMPMAAEPQAAAGPITSMGKITAIDAAVGTVTLDHQAIPEVKWDAMSMGFTTTDPAMLKDLKVGDMVVFDLMSAAEPTKISRIVKQ
jgi:Cu(I)/Ag(I) efflux system protein CusF